MNTESLPEKLILASSSRYRKMLLERLGLPFKCISPEINETAKTGEQPIDLVNRLALQKAQAVSNHNPDAVVIGSDQLAVFRGQIIGKPGCFDEAFTQLTRFSGQSVEFLTAVTVLCHQSDYLEQFTDKTSVYFRALQNDEINRYLQKEQPFDCAGAFKAESLGITLFEKITSEDPTALIGLPLIRTSMLLRESGLQLP